MRPSRPPELALDPACTDKEVNFGLVDESTKCAFTLV